MRLRSVLQDRRRLGNREGLRSLGLVPAAGAAERFGGAKLIADVGGEPLLQRTLRSLLDGGVTTLVVVLGPEAERIRAGVPLLGDPRVRSVINPDPGRGMFSSLQTALAAGSAGEPLVVLPGDMPFVNADTVRALLDTYERAPAIVSPRFHGKRGHPVILPPELGGEILAAEPTSNLHLILRVHPDRRVDVAVEDEGVGRDVDTVGDLSR